MNRFCCARSRLSRLFFFLLLIRVIKRKTTSVCQLKNELMKLVVIQYLTLPLTFFRHRFLFLIDYCLCLTHSSERCVNRSGNEDLVYVDTLCVSLSFFLCYRLLVILACRKSVHTFTHRDTYASIPRVLFFSLLFFPNFV